MDRHAHQGRNQVPPNNPAQYQQAPIEQQPVRGPVQDQQVQGGQHPYQQAPAQPQWTPEDSMAYVERTLSDVKSLVEDIETYGELRLQEASMDQLREQDPDGDLDPNNVIKTAYRLAGKSTRESTSASLNTVEGLYQELSDSLVSLRNKAVQDDSGYDLKKTGETMEQELDYVEEVCEPVPHDVERLRESLYNTFDVLDTEDYRAETDRGVIIEDMLDTRTEAVDWYLEDTVNELQDYVKEVAAFEQDRQSGDVSDAVPTRYGVSLRMQGEELGPDEKGFD